MILNWYKAFNQTDFEATDLVSRNKTLSLDIGDTVVTIFKGNLVSVEFDNTFLSVDLNDKNPFVFENHGVYIDDNDDIWIGFAP